jgi:hypothetical protein
MKRMWRGKKYAGLTTLKAIRRRGFAVVEPGTFFDPGPTCWWHRSERAARERVRRLRAKARSAYLVRLGVESVTTPALESVTTSEEN